MPAAEWIVADPGVLGGKRCIRGTRISVELVLELLASGASRDDIITAYPHLQVDGLQARNVDVSAIKTRRWRR